MADRIYPHPRRRLALSEGPRALGEFASYVYSAPLLHRAAPRGSPHTALVLPGFGGSDRSTAVLRGYIAALGYQALPWGLGRNLGPAMPGLLHDLTERLQDAYDARRQPVTLIGWSLGGVYARLLAHALPQRVRQVITLGSPFAGDPRSTRAYRVAEALSTEPLDRGHVRRLRLAAAKPLPEIPSTAIFSRSDGVVPWQIAMETPSALAENIEVVSSHIGLGMNPAVFYAIADRLAQRPDRWRPFERRGWKRLVYGPAWPPRNEGHAH